MSNRPADDSEEETSNNGNTNIRSLSSNDNPTYITIETNDGQLEHVKVHVNDEHFGTSAPILNYLAQQGEIRPNKHRGSSRREKSAPRHHRPSEALNPADAFDLEIRSRGERAGSVMITPALIKDLKKNRARIVAKGGQCNVTMTNVSKLKRQFFRDIFTTAVDMQWRFTLLAFVASFFLSWLIFAVVYFVIGIYRGDYEPDHLPAGAAQVNGTWKPCIWAIEDFTSCFLFSLETQHTIGYGSRQITERCPEAIITVAVQSVVGVIISACMAGIVFAKLARPKCRTNTIVFSKNAVITKRNGHIYLLFRVGNMRRSHLIETHVSAQLVHHKRNTSEGESIQYDMEELKVNTHTYFRQNQDGTDSGTEDEDEHEEEPTQENVLLLWPVTVAHRIDKSSPFYAMGPREILAAKFELIVTLGGVNETNGNSVQARSSYLPNEILWGYRFSNLLTYTKESRFYLVDFSNLNAVKPDDTPRMSVKDLELRKVFYQKDKSVRTPLAAKSPESTKIFTISRSSYLDVSPRGGAARSNKSNNIFATSTSSLNSAPVSPPTSGVYTMPAGSSQSLSDVPELTLSPIKNNLSRRSSSQGNSEKTYF